MIRGKLQKMRKILQTPRRGGSSLHLGLGLVLAVLSANAAFGSTSNCSTPSTDGSPGCGTVDQTFNNNAAPLSIEFVGTTTGTGGDTLSASATFILPGSTDAYGNACTGSTGTLCLTLVNTQAGGTTSRGDLLDALYFSVTGNPTLTPASALANTIVNPSSTNTPVLSVSPQASPLAGGWALATTPGIDSVNPGLPTSGYAWSTVGNSGAISNGTYNVGSDDYGIIAPGSSYTGGGSHGIPVIQTEVFLTLSGFGTNSLTSISGVVFTWNSTGQFSVAGQEATPEPSTFLLFGSALAGIALLKARRSAS